MEISDIDELIKSNEARKQEIDAESSALKKIKKKLEKETEKTSQEKTDLSLT